MGLHSADLCALRPRLTPAAIRSSLPGDLLQRLVACPEQQLRQYELLLRRLLCALLPRASAAASMTSSVDLQTLVQAAEVVLAMTDWDRWSRAGMEKDHAWCVARTPARPGLSDHSILRCAVGFDSTICWGMLATLTASGMLEEAAAFLQVSQTLALTPCAQSQRALMRALSMLPCRLVRCTCRFS